MENSKRQNKRTRDGVPKLETEKSECQNTKVDKDCKSMEVDFDCSNSDDDCENKMDFLDDEAEDDENVDEESIESCDDDFINDQEEDGEDGEEEEEEEEEQKYSLDEDEDFGNGENYIDSDSENSNDWKKRTISYHKILLPPIGGFSEYPDYISSIVEYVNDRNGNYNEARLSSSWISMLNSTSSSKLEDGSDFSVLQFEQLAKYGKADGSTVSYMWFFYREDEIFCITSGGFLNAFHKFEQFCCTQFPKSIMQRLVDTADVMSAVHVNILDGAISKVSNICRGVDIDFFQNVCSYMEKSVRHQCSIFELEPFVQDARPESLYIGCGYAHLQFSRSTRFEHFGPLLRYFSKILKREPTYTVRTMTMEGDAESSIFMGQVEKASKAQTELLDLKLLEYIRDYGCTDSDTVSRNNHSILRQLQIGNLEYNWPLDCADKCRLFCGSKMEAYLSSNNLTVQELLDALFRIEKINQTKTDIDTFRDLVKNNVRILYKFFDIPDKEKGSFIDIFQGEMTLEGIGRFWKLFGSWNVLCDDFVWYIDHHFVNTLNFHWKSKKYCNKIWDLSRNNGMQLVEKNIRHYLELYKMDENDQLAQEPNENADEEGNKNEHVCKDMYILPCTNKSNMCIQGNGSSDEIADCYNDEKGLFGEVLINIKLLKSGKTQTCFMFIINGFGSGLVRQKLLDIEYFMENIRSLDNSFVDQKWKMKFFNYLESHSDPLFNKTFETARKFVNGYLKNEMIHRTARVVLGFAKESIMGPRKVWNFQLEKQRLRLIGWDSDNDQLTKLGGIIDDYISHPQIDKQTNMLVSSDHKKSRLTEAFSLVGSDDGVSSTAWNENEIVKAFRQKLIQKGYISSGGTFSGKLFKLADVDCGQKFELAGQEYADVNQGLFDVIRIKCLPGFLSQIDKIGLIRLCNVLKQFDVTIEDVKVLA